MTGIDTNILARYLVHDDPREAKKAADFIENRCTREEPGFVNQIVLSELVWVLESSYDYQRGVIADVLEKILVTSQFEIEQKDTVWDALKDYRETKADFADCLLGRKNRASGCETTMTFDKGLKNLETFRVI